MELECLECCDEQQDDDDDEGGTDDGDAKVSVEVCSVYVCLEALSWCRKQI